jgi:hypothetical protein
MDRAAYRARQFLSALHAHLRPEDRARVLARLGPNHFRLFLRLPPADQAHALRVHDSLASHGHNDPDLLAAALLHDVGKSLVPLRLIDRITIVLGQTLLPGRVRSWQAGDPTGWRRPFVVACHHPEWGATMIQDTGGSARLVTLIRRHQESGHTASPDPRDVGLAALAALAALQAADGDS